TLLIRATEVIKKSTRQEDIVARWGGDEFIILLPRTTETVAHNIANRIQNDCEGDEYAIRLSIAMGSATRIRTDKDIREIIQDAENRMYRNKLTESRTIHTSLIASLERSLWNTTPETEKHVRRMQRLSCEVGLVANLKSNQPEELELLARLHDLGKVAIPRDILNKTGPLTKEEWEVVKKHSEIGYRILVSTPEYASLADFVLTHHERWDGTGYPQGLKGEAIPLLARINAVVEAYEVMTAGRPYKLPLPLADTINELQRCAGSQFDPWVVELFVETMKRPRMETLP
ncbi:MAG: HD-GYP domain-containing protein, partial [Atribacterota bacterium]